MNWKLYYSKPTKDLERLKKEKEEAVKRLLINKPRHWGATIDALRLQLWHIDNELVSRQLTKQMFPDE